VITLSYPVLGIVCLLAPSSSRSFGARPSRRNHIPSEIVPRGAVCCGGGFLWAGGIIPESDVVVDVTVHRLVVGIVAVVFRDVRRFIRHFPTKPINGRPLLLVRACGPRVMGGGARNDGGEDKSDEGQKSIDSSSVLRLSSDRVAHEANDWPGQISPRLGDVQANLDKHLQSSSRRRRRVWNSWCSGAFAHRLHAPKTWRTKWPHAALDDPLLAPLMEASYKLDLVIAWRSATFAGALYCQPVPGAGPDHPFYRKVYLPTSGMFDEGRD